MQAYVYRGPTPLGPYNQSAGHGWHAYTKLPHGPDTKSPRSPGNATVNATVNATGNATPNGTPNGTPSATYRVRDGYLPTGHDWIAERLSTVAAAEALCSSSVACRGFTFKAHARRPPPTQQVRWS